MAGGRDLHGQRECKSSTDKLDRIIIALYAR
jgi:hypothetical protein